MKMILSIQSLTLDKLHGEKYKFHFHYNEDQTLCNVQQLYPVLNYESIIGRNIEQKWNSTQYQIILHLSHLRYEIAKAQEGNPL